MSQPVRGDATRNRQALNEVATRPFVSAGADGEPSLRLMAREAGVGIGTVEPAQAGRQRSRSSAQPRMSDSIAAFDAP